MRYLCFDIGEKRTGVAAGDDETGLAGPVEVITCLGEDALVDALVQVIEREGVVEVVVGLPLHMDGVEGKRAERRHGGLGNGGVGLVRLGDGTADAREVGPARLRQAGAAGRTRRRPVVERHHGRYDDRRPGGDFQP